MSGTVQTIQPASAPLTQGEAWEFAAAMMQQAPRDLDPTKVRHYLSNKSLLGKELRELLGKPLPAFDTGEWEIFYKTHFGYTGGFAGLNVPQKPEYSCRAIVVVTSLTNNRVFDACTKAFKGKTWRYENDLDTVKDVVKRPSTPYVVWVHSGIEADADMANKSANDIEKEGINTLTLKERMLLELKFHDEGGNHLDIENVTLCSGSRYSDGYVPGAHWLGGRFYVNWYLPDRRLSSLRGRVAVS